VGYRQVFASPPYRRFWLGFSVSALGDSMSQTALVWFVYSSSSGSPGAVGTLMFAYSAPILAGGLLAGPLLDRFDRRRVMVADNLIRAAAFAAIPILHWMGALALWHVYVSAATYGFLMMISLAGGPALVPSLVPREHLATANALEILAFTLGRVIGPALAGALLPRMGAPAILALDAASYLVFALMLARIAAPRPAARVAGGGGLGPALRLLAGHPVLVSTTVMFTTYNLGAGALSVWLPVLADRTLGGDAGLYGGLLACMAAGEIAASLGAGRWRPPLSLGTLICLSQVGAGLALLGVLAAARAGAGVPAVGAALFLWGMATAPLTIWAQTLRMRIIPEALRGRAFALLRTIMQGGRPLGALAAGYLLPLAGVGAMIALSALLAGAPGLAGSRVRALREAGRPGD
jgi:predicted MFS family arabinose efflux permease